jgi:hypothetical protein
MDAAAMNVGVKERCGRRVKEGGDPMKKALGWVVEVVL